MAKQQKKNPPQPITLHEEIARINSIIKEAFEESDRAGAVLLGAELDNLLKQVLEIYFLPAQKNSIDPFSQDGPVGTFSARIELSYRLGFLHPGMHHDLHVIRRIRNRFAHAERGVDLQEDQLKSFCLNLLQAQGMIDHFDREAEEKGSTAKIQLKPKDRLILTGASLLANISLLRVNVRRTHAWFLDWIKPTGGPGVDVPLTGNPWVDGGDAASTELEAKPASGKFATEGPSTEK